MKLTHSGYVTYDVTDKELPFVLMHLGVFLCPNKYKYSIFNKLIALLSTYIYIINNVNNIRIKMEYKRKKIEGYDNYEIDNVGNVYSLKNGFNGKSKDGKLSNRLVAQGYHQVSLYSGSKTPKQLLVHRLVWEAFNGPIPEGMTIDHIDADKTNNTLSNLQLMTRTDNLKKMWDMRGRSQKKELVKDWLARGYSRKFISDNLGIGQPYISLIANGKR